MLASFLPLKVMIGSDKKRIAHRELLRQASDLLLGVGRGHVWLQTKLVITDVHKAPVNAIILGCPDGPPLIWQKESTENVW